MTPSPSAAARPASPPPPSSHPVSPSTPPAHPSGSRRPTLFSCSCFPIPQYHHPDPCFLLHFAFDAPTPLLGASIASPRVPAASPASCSSDQISPRISKGSCLGLWRVWCLLPALNHLMVIPTHHRDHLLPIPSLTVRTQRGITACHSPFDQPPW